MDIIISYAQTMPHRSQASSFSNKGMLLTIDEGIFGNNRTRNSMSWFESEWIMIFCQMVWLCQEVIRMFNKDYHN